MIAERTTAARTLDLYERWAPTYPPQAHNPLMRAEQAAMLAALPEVAGVRAMDLACGTGRYAQLLRQRSVASVVAVDFSPAMLQRADVPRRVQADMTRLPFVSASFDIVVSGLAVGHVRHLVPWAGELSRTLAAGGTVLYSDFHPEAARVGLTRSFKDASEGAWTLPHYRHELVDHLDALATAGFTIELVRELRAGREVNEVFAGSERFYREHAALPLVLIVRAHR
jgi:ubiquinone/menaquinone biosynthesis C-methylase UbiE